MSMRPWWISIRHGLLSGNGGCTHYDFCHCIGSLWEKSFGTISVLGILLRLCVSLPGIPSGPALFTFWLLPDLVP